MPRQILLLIAAAFLVQQPTSQLLADENAADVLIADSFETGTKAPKGWKQGASVPGVKYVYDRRVGSKGDRSLSLQKSANRYFPIAGWSRIFPHKSDKPVIKVAAKVKASKATKAVIDVLFLDASEEWIKHEWVAYIGQKESSDPVATHDWKVYGDALEVPPGTKQIGIAFQIYGPGKVWFDELDARYFDSLEAANKDDAAKKGKPEVSGTRSGVSNTSEAKVELPVPIEVSTTSGGIAKYLLVPPSDAETREAHPLLLVLPGGDGSMDFHPFVRRIHEDALDGKFVVAQPLAPPHIVWPTSSSSRHWGTTEESIAAIIDDVSSRHMIDRSRIYALAWSSSGPAVYATFLQDNSPLSGAFIAMSVFKPEQLPPLANAAGRRVYLLHSPDDTVCPHWMARSAHQQLSAEGAEVKLVDYSGGHGWHGPVYDNIRAGVDWLQNDRSQ